MELITLLERMKMEHLLAQLDGVCEPAAKGDLDYKGFLAQALETEWRGRHQRGVESRLRLARFPWIKTLEQFDFCKFSVNLRHLFSSGMRHRLGHRLREGLSPARREGGCFHRWRAARSSS